MRTASRPSARLWQRALALPLARSEDFASSPVPNGDAAAYRIVDASALRARLVLAGLAQIVQSSRGRQRRKIIIRLVEQGQHVPGRREFAPRSVALSDLPHVEDLGLLVARILETEAQLSAEKQRNLDKRIGSLKARLASTNGDAFEIAFRELQAAMNERTALRQLVRREAFQRIRDEATFAPRRYLDMIAVDVGAPVRAGP